MLGPSERVVLIQEIAARLSRQEWPVIDLTLRQFALPTEDEWRGERLPYAIQMVDEAPDDTLIDLAAHLGYDHRARASAIAPSFWRQGNFRLFITHLARHKDVATSLQEALSGFHISSFVAHKDIEPTREWINEIELALSTADALLALLHPGFKESNWTDQETGFALGKGVLVITIRFGQDPYGFLGKAQAVQGEGKSAFVLASELFRLLARHKQSRKAMAEALVRGFELSDSFAEAKSNLALLEGAEYWDSRFPDMLLNAIESNAQISGAWGVPDRVKRLVEKQKGVGA